MDEQLRLSRAVLAEWHRRGDDENEDLSPATPAQAQAGHDETSTLGATSFASLATFERGFPASKGPHRYSSVFSGS